MAASTDHSLISFFSYFTGFSAYRLAIGVPLEGVTKREILERKTTLKVIQSTPVLELRRGFQPNAIKYLSSSYLQIGSTWLASSLTPTQLPPTLRGVLIGVLTTSMEASVRNVWNVLVTRFIQGDNWNVVQKEGVSLLTKGLSPALLHRGFSSTVYWGLYEPLHNRYPGNPFGVGFAVGIIQVLSTSPFYIATVRRQAKLNPGEAPLPKSLRDLMKQIAKSEGVVRGLFVRGLTPRLIHSTLTSGPLMFMLEKYHIIHR
ncbi:MAG: hypothetical protein KBA81_07620 [Rhabdochlamydiaceae bacterium]|nr:hypothetical protein [Rhabdochlamydiaceae bacterium]